MRRDYDRRHPRGQALPSRSWTGNSPRQVIARARAFSPDGVVDVATVDQDLADDQTTLVINDWRFVGRSPRRDFAPTWGDVVRESAEIRFEGLTGVVDGRRGRPQPSGRYRPGNDAGVGEASIGSGADRALAGPEWV